MKLKKTIAFFTALVLMLLPVGAMAAVGDLAWAVERVSGSFDPFAAGCDGDEAVERLTILKLFGKDRSGAYVTNGDETREYNGAKYTYSYPASCLKGTDAEGRVCYDITLKNGIRYSDGSAATIDDVIFAMYVLLDASYDGGLAFASLPVLGLSEYRYGIDTDTSAAMAEEAAFIRECGYDVSYEEAAFYWRDCLEEGGARYAQKLAESYCEEYPSVETFFGGNKVAAAMYIWEFGTVNPAVTEMNSKLLGKKWSLADGEYPEAADFWHALEATFMKGEDDMEGLEVLRASVSNGTDLMTYVDQAYAEAKSGGGQPRDAIDGIIRVSDDTVRVVLTKDDERAVAAIAQIPVVSCVYYGDGTGMDIANNDFGFPKGDISCVKKRASSPMGAGPYIFSEMTDKGALLKANESYRRGQPVTRTVEVVECDDGNACVGIMKTDYDVIETDLTIEEVSALRVINSDTGSVNGNVAFITDTGRGRTCFAAISADRVHLNDDASSVKLRRLLGTLLRNVYADACDADAYIPAFDAQDCANALAAAKFNLIGLGYVFDEEAGRFVQAPENASLSYTLLFAGGYANPMYEPLIALKKALDELGIELVLVNTNPTDLTRAYASGDYDILIAASEGITDAEDGSVTTLYHHRNVLMFSAKRIKRESLPADMTESYNWVDEIEKIAVYN